MNKFFGAALILLGIALAFIPQATDCPAMSSSSMGNMNGSMTTPPGGMGGSMTTNPAAMNNSMATTTKIMKCQQTSRAEVFIAIPIIALGLILILSKNRWFNISAGIVGVVLGVVSILLMTTFIGTCAMPTMHCNTTMKPFVFIIGGLITAISLAALLFNWSAKDPDQKPVN